MKTTGFILIITFTLLVASCATINEEVTFSEQSTLALLMHEADGHETYLQKVELETETTSGAPIILQSLDEFGYSKVAPGNYAILGTMTAKTPLGSIVTEFELTCYPIAPVFSLEAGKITILGRPTDVRIAILKAEFDGLVSDYTVERANYLLNQNASVSGDVTPVSVSSFIMMDSLKMRNWRRYCANDGTFKTISSP
ncbi:MAG: hypothetical protein MRY72_06700 [Aquisalinus sp.]|nr:hypothetical protein [Aquisalinus sp.]